VGVAISFAMALRRAWTVHGAGDLACVQGNLDRNSYLQLEVFEQDPTGPFFHGNLMIIVGGERETIPSQMVISTSGGRGYAGNRDSVRLVYDSEFKTAVTKEPVTTEFVRTRGSHRDFPFDSAKFDFGVSWNPPVPLTGVMVRNYNPSFYLPCQTFSVEKNSTGLVRLKFEMHRDPLVQLTAVVLVAAGFVFLLGIVFFVERGALPTSIASFFFSLWSIRAILSSEMKVFPTILDLSILSLCVSLVVMIGARVAIQMRVETD
jgi:hypothetical protein